VFACGEENLASGVCRGDSSDGPLLLSVFNGVEDVTLIKPPAPDFVLQAQGPEQFSKRFDKKPNEVFPLTIKVIPQFQKSRKTDMLLLAFNTTNNTAANIAFVLLGLMKLAHQHL